MMISASTDTPTLVGVSVSLALSDTVLTIEKAEGDWRLDLSLDETKENLTFDVALKPDNWLAVCFAQDCLNADVLQWAAELESERSDIEDPGTAEQTSHVAKVYDRVTVKGNLIDGLLSGEGRGIEVTSTFDADEELLKMTTTRPLDTGDPLD